MAQQQLIFNSTNVLDGVWQDVSPYGVNWSLHIEQIGSDTVLVEVSNQIPVPAPPVNNNPVNLRPMYPPYPKPQSVTSYTAEVHSVPASAPYQVTVTHAPTTGQTLQDEGVVFTDAANGEGVSQNSITTYPPQGGYAPNPTTGVYQFAPADAGRPFKVSYNIIAPSVGIPLFNSGSNSNNLFSIPATGVDTGNNNQTMIYSAGNLGVKWIRVRKTVKSGAGSPTVAFLATSNSD